MKLSCLVEDLLPLARNASRVVSRRDDVLVSQNCMLLEVNGKNVSLTGSDFTTWITTKTVIHGASGKWSGGLPGIKFMSILSALPATETMTIEVKNKIATLKAGRGQYKLAVTPESEFARTDARKDERVIEFDREALLQVLERTSYAMADNDVRYYLNGMQIRSGAQGEWRFAATDGHRLAILQLSSLSDSGPPGECAAIIPGGVVRHIQAILKGQKDESVTLRLTQAKGELLTEKVSVAFSLIDGRYPDIDAVIPDSSEATFRVARGAFMDATRRAAIFRDGKTGGLVLSLKDGALDLCCRGEVDSGEESVDVTDHSGSPTTKTAFQPAYLLQALEALPGDFVQFKMGADTASMLTHPEGADMMHLVMPQRL